MKSNRFLVIVVSMVLLLSFLAMGQGWSDEDRENIKTVMTDKFELSESVSFIQEGAFVSEGLKVFPSPVEITEGGLDSGLTVALVQYGEETFLPLFVLSLPETDTPYGYSLVNEEGDVVYVNPVGIQGADDGPDLPVVELEEELEEHVKLVLKFKTAVITVDLPVNNPVEG